MNKNFSRMLLMAVLQLVLVLSATSAVFASEPIFTLVPTSITGRVWVGSSDAHQTTPAANVPVFVQRIDQANTDVVMTMVVYTDDIGGFALEGLATGTYQIWTGNENDSDALFYQIVTIDESSPTATADLLITGYRVFMPTVMR